MTDFTSTFRRTSYPRIAPAKHPRDGKVVLVTGSSEGIGYNIANAFAEAHAATVILISRSQEKLSKAVAQLTERHHDTKIIARTCDMSSSTDVQSLLPSLAKEGICPDTLILNAGATEQPKASEELLSNLQFAIGANIILCEAFQTQASPSGRPKCLVNISSAGMHCYPGMASQTIYHTGKAGLAAYIAHATEMIPQSETRMISLHPGCVFTGAVERNSAGTEGVSKLPIWDDPSLAAHMAVWVTSQEAAFLHGRFIWANWDVEELLGMKERILADPAMLKVGVIGTGPFNMAKLMERCAKSPLS